MLCEVCRGLAVDRTPPGYDGMKISCSTCGNYSIAGNVLNKFRQLSLNERDRVLQKAKGHLSLGSPLINEAIGSGLSGGVSV